MKVLANSMMMNDAFAMLSSSGGVFHANILQSSVSPQQTMPDSLDNLNRRLLTFARERDWEQFHTPKNLSMALAGECGELLEHFQWLTESQSACLAADKKTAVSHELADILIYLIRLAERLDIDLIAAAEAKIALNERRYPVHQVRGDARRAEEYSTLDHPTPSKSVVAAESE
jgi:NTP pyrophosphatase (non-canonical NTP hydrolase)